MAPVSATVTFSADDPIELGRIFSAIGDALQQATFRAQDSTGPVAPVPARESMTVGDWYRSHGAEFAGRLRPNARNALQAIVAEGPSVPFDRVREIVGLAGPALAGSLASVGAAVSALKAPAPPFRADHKRQVYLIEPDIQDALRTHLE
jgi:hypothetical protein